MRLKDGEDFAAAPVLAGLIEYHELFDGSRTLVDLARMNEWLMVKSENEARAVAAARKE